MLSVVITVRNYCCGKVIFTARKRSLGQDNIFSSVCQEFCSQFTVHSSRGYPRMHCRWYPSMLCSRGVSQHALQVSRPTPRRKLRGLARGGLQAHTWGIGVSPAHTQGVYPSIHWGRTPWWLLRAVCILLECVLVSQASVILSMGGGGMCGRGCAWGRGHVWWRGHLWWRGHVVKGAFVVKGGMCGEGGVWQKGGVCGEGGHAWQRGACVAKGGVHGRGHAWQETATAVDGTHPTGMHSCFTSMCQEFCPWGGGVHPWADTLPRLTSALGKHPPGSSSGSRGRWPPGPVKISHKKDGRQRRLHRFHVSQPPLPGRWIRYWADTHPRADTPSSWADIPPPPWQPPNQTATAADGTHPTGMHVFILKGF